MSKVMHHIVILGSFIIVQEVNISQAEKKLNDFTEHKAILEKNQRFIKFLNPKHQDKSRFCASTLVFNLYQHSQNLEELKRKLKHANFCKHRFCAVCQWRQSMMLQMETLSRIEQLQGDLKIDALMLTITVTNPQISDLKNTIKHMSKAWQKYIRRKFFMQAVVGWVRALELMGDETQKGYAHPHYHVLLIVRSNYFTGSRYVKHEEWRKAWEECYGSKGLQVHIQRVKPKKNTLKDPISSACAEVCKYSVKATDVDRLDDEDLNLLIKQSKKIRSYTIGGRLKDYEPKIEELDESQWIFLKEEYFKWNKFRHDYVQKEK